MDTQARGFEVANASIKTIAADVASKHADDVDTKARFPKETIDALRRARLLSAPVPVRYGGAGLGIRELGELCAALAQTCGSSAMVLAMHYNQLACVARHSRGSAFFETFLREVAEGELLLASMTSEVGTFGDTRSSICAVVCDGQNYKLEKDATTGSYCAHADAILITARRHSEASAGDQVLVLARPSQFTLTQTSNWDTMGMRGTCSPGFKIVIEAPVEQILPMPYADIAAQSMVPYSHILWSGLWWGLAAGAQAKAATFVRGQARKNPGTVPPTATLLADLTVKLQSMANNWRMLADDFDTCVRHATDAIDLNGMSWALRMNGLKTACSEAAPQIVHGALQIVGILGYKNDSPFAMGRAYRDSLSASLMVSNERIAAKSAAMLLVFKDD